jgi:hypothetical protein
MTLVPIQSAYAGWLGSPSARWLAQANRRGISAIPRPGTNEMFTLCELPTGPVPVEAMTGCYRALISRHSIQSRSHRHGVGGDQSVIRRRSCSIQSLSHRRRVGGDLPVETGRVFISSRGLCSDSHCEHLRSGRTSCFGIRMAQPLVAARPGRCCARGRATQSRRCATKRSSVVHAQFAGGTRGLTPPARRGEMKKQPSNELAIGERPAYAGWLGWSILMAYG